MIRHKIKVLVQFWIQDGKRVTLLNFWRRTTEHNKPSPTSVTCDGNNYTFTTMEYESYQGRCILFYLKAFYMHDLKLKGICFGNIPI